MRKVWYQRAMLPLAGCLRQGMRQQAARVCMALEQVAPLGRSSDDSMDVVRQLIAFFNSGLLKQAARDDARYKTKPNPNHSH